ncbi:hypothetical protein [Sphingobacterium multivorum]|uniref:hypothetical protein n=1 Tax=Sphingobacterium multivorum TaxID=28454 RepID=UPI0028A7123D|nr:hypothetical protein [Sphingobacterium multivorum]
MRKQTTLPNQTDNLISLMLSPEEIDRLENLLYQINYFNDCMEADRSNAVITALVDFNDGEGNGEVLSEGMQLIYRLGINSSFIKNLADKIKEGANHGI